MPTEMENPLYKLTPEQIEAIGKEFDELHDEVFDSLGERDAKYIRGIIALHRRLVLIARLELLGAKYKPMWVLGTATLGLAKILENMEIGHNVMHGQWDWMNDPVINSTSWDWDTASTKEAWKHSHNYIHHTYTNVLGLDKDLGYEVMRIDPNQKWHPRYLAQPVVNLFLMAFFEWGVAVHDLDIDAIRAGEKKWPDIKDDLKGMGGKARAQVIKDYIAFPRAQRGRHDRGRARGAQARGVAPAALEEAGRPAARPAAAHARPADAGRDRPGRVPQDVLGRLHGQHHPQRVVQRDHLLRPLPGPDVHVHQGRLRRRDPRRALRAPAARRREHRRRPDVPHRLAATSATRSSTTCTRTCPARATARSRPRCARSASATSCPTTPDRSCSSGGWCSARSCGWRSPAASRARSRGPTRATRCVTRASAPDRVAA